MKGESVGGMGAGMKEDDEECLLVTLEGANIRGGLHLLSTEIPFATCTSVPLQYLLSQLYEYLLGGFGGTSDSCTCTAQSTPAF